MAGGDLLYIFAFIILPTAVLVSCIWALVMLRKGALLPVRPVIEREGDPAADRDEEKVHDDANPVEETGEHVAIEPASTATVLVASNSAIPVGEAVPAAEPVDDAEAGLPPMAESPRVVTAEDEPLAVERTQELTVLPVEVVGAGDAMRDEAEPDDREAVVEQPGSDRQDAVQAPPAGNPASVLIVPLDDVAHPAAASTPPPREPQMAQRSGGQPVAPPATATTPRRSARRVVQLRPTEAEPVRPRPRTGQRRVARRPEE